MRFVAAAALALVGWLAGINCASAQDAAMKTTPTTKILAIGTINPGFEQSQVRAVLPEEVRETVDLYLAGKKAEAIDAEFASLHRVSAESFSGARRFADGAGRHGAPQASGADRCAVPTRRDLFRGPFANARSPLTGARRRSRMVEC